MMPTSDALVVVEDWISEHYFTTDATRESFTAKVVERRREWDSAEQTTPRERFLASRNQLGMDLSRLYDEDDPVLLRAVHRQLLDILGYGQGGGWSVEEDGPIVRYRSPGLQNGDHLAVLFARALDTVDDIFAKDEPTIEPTIVDDVEHKSLSRVLSALFVSEDDPSWALVLAGRWLIVAEKGRWAEGRCLAVDIQTVAERNETRRAGEIDRALTCVEATSLAPDADGRIWWADVLEESIKHTVGVSKDLREGVRQSIEIIANDVVSRRASQGLPPLPPEDAQPLAIEALRYLYRILFLLYAEASPEMGVLPSGDPNYEQGYSLDRLRELILADLISPDARSGTHLHSSLSVLFRLVDRGHRPKAADDEIGDGLTFHGLRADLFKTDATRRIDEVGLSDEALQRVLRKLLLSKEIRGRDRGFISYVDLGINQLGAVYEGLMSYTGSFAATDLYEVAPAGNPENGSWVVPVERAEGIGEDDFVRTEDPITGAPKRVLHRRGTFVFRLSGRERQQSASYYTPEVLTKFTVSQALAELLDQDGQVTSADEVLGMTVCEPALGSGAFAIEAVRQLAEEYLKRRERELDRTVDPDERPQVLQRIKAHIALHQVYGVDLNATAVELAEISLWLDTMASGLQAPWFGLRLRRGNSLIGARHAVYTEQDLKNKKWSTTPPIDVPLSNLVSAAEAESSSVDGIEGRIHHFLLPAQGWGATAEAAEAKQLAPDQARAIRDWSRSLRKQLTATQVRRLRGLTERVEVLWQYAWRRLTIAEAESSRIIKVWGRENSASEPAAHVTREQIEASLADPDGAYRRLRRVMDAWCALWFWPVTTSVRPPSMDQWLDALEGILGRPVQASTRERRQAAAGQSVLSGSNWDDLGEAEALDLAFAQAKLTRDLQLAHPWLEVAAEVAEQQGFFHWELDFAVIFGKGGFDLQLGNPPWVRPDTDVDLFLADDDPWWALAHNPNEDQRRERLEYTLSIEGAKATVTRLASEVVALRESVSSKTSYPVLAGLRPDLYRCFMVRTWFNMSPRGVCALIHWDTHFTDERAGRFRSATYRHLRRHWEFHNELKLFREIGNRKHYSVNVYAGSRRPEFYTATGLYHPRTLEASAHHDGSGPAPGFKDDSGNWDLRPHADRIIAVSPEMLTLWRDVLEEPDVPPECTRMLYTVNRDVAAVLEKLARAPRIKSIDLQFSAGWNEKTDRTKGRFVQKWGRPTSWDDVILQGPHLFVNNPTYKAPNRSMKNNKDWSEVALEALPADYVPITSYKPAGDRLIYDTAYTHWDGVSARNVFRIAWRAMVDNGGERTLMSALLPPGTAHIHGIMSAWSEHTEMIPYLAGQMSSLLHDFSVRVAPKAVIYSGAINRLPLIDSDSPVALPITLRALRLMCVSDAYSELWEGSWNDAFRSDAWTWTTSGTTDLANVGKRWQPHVLLRRSTERRQAQLEIDALVALGLRVSAEELATVYRTQFPVLRSYDRGTHKSINYVFDRSGRLVPGVVWRAYSQGGESLSEDDRTHTDAMGNTYTYELPFRNYDREADMRHAYAVFAERLGTG